MNFKTISAQYWLKVFLLYALFEAGIQLLFLFTLNTFGNPISDWQFHLIMWFFQSVFILPIWLVAFTFRQHKIWIQVLFNAAFFVVYTFFWYNVVQDWVAFLHTKLLHATQPDASEHRATPIDTWKYFHYQLLKHALRLGWFYVANFFYNYRREEQQRLQLSLANKELQLNLVKWSLNPDFYFKTLDIISEKAKTEPAECPALILTLSQVMEYVLYRSKEKFIPVADEITFLKNYIFLLNQDNRNQCSYGLQVTGTYAHLKIIPLLIVSIIESQLNHCAAGTERLVIVISFENDNLQLEILPGANNAKQITGPLLIRLQEYYPLRYQFATNGKEPYWLKMQLHAT